MYKVLIVSHSILCKGFNEAAKMILGLEADVNYLELNEEGIDTFHENLKNKIKELKHQGDEILILADLFGGTPFNRSLIEASKDKKIKVISGVNLPMVIEAVTNEKSDLDEIFSKLMATGKDSIRDGIILNNDDLDNE